MPTRVCPAPQIDEQRGQAQSAPPEACMCMLPWHPTCLILIDMGKHLREDLADAVWPALAKAEHPKVPMLCTNSNGAIHLLDHAASVSCTAQTPSCSKAGQPERAALITDSSSSKVSRAAPPGAAQLAGSSRLQPAKLPGSADACARWRCAGTWQPHSLHRQCGCSPGRRQGEVMPLSLARYCCCRCEYGAALAAGEGPQLQGSPAPVSQPGPAMGGAEEDEAGSGVRQLLVLRGRCLGGRSDQQLLDKNASHATGHTQAGQMTEPGLPAAAGPSLVCPEQLPAQEVQPAACSGQCMHSHASTPSGPQHPASGCWWQAAQPEPDRLSYQYAVQPAAVAGARGLPVTDKDHRPAADACPRQAVRQLADRAPQRKALALPPRRWSCSTAGLKNMVHTCTTGIPGCIAGWTAVLSTRPVTDRSALHSFSADHQPVLHRHGMCSACTHLHTPGTAGGQRARRQPARRRASSLRASAAGPAGPCRARGAPSY